MLSDMEEYINKDKVVDDLLLLVAKKNKRIKELEDTIGELYDEASHEKTDRRSET